MAVYHVSHHEARKVAGTLSRNRFNPEGVGGLSAAIVLLTILISIYHHSYDCLLVVVPWVGVTFYGGKRFGLGSFRRWLVSLLLAIPAANYVSTRTFRNFFEIDQASINWQYITVVNGACLLLALLVLLFTAFFTISNEDSLE